MHAGVGFALACAAFLLILFRRSIFQGQALIGRDLTAVHQPWRWFEAEAMRAGRLPLWNPLNFMGEAALANPQSACFYPGSLIFLPWEFPTALVVFTCAHLLLACVGMYALCRRLRCCPSAAAIAGAAFGFGGWMLTRVESPPELASCAWMPLAVLVALEATSRASLRWAAGLGVLLAVQLSAGNLNATYNSGLAVGLAWLGTLAATWPAAAWLPRLRRVAVLPVGMLVAIVLFSAQAFPTAELVMQSARAKGVNDALATQWAVPAFQWLRFVVPFLFGGVGYGRHWGGAVAEFDHGAFYIGVIPLLFAAGACIAACGRSLGRKHRRLVLFVAVAVAFFAVAATGDQLGLYQVLRRGLPGFNRFHSPYKLMMLASFGVALLGGLGWHATASQVGGLKPSFRVLTWLIPAIMFLAVYSSIPRSPLRDGIYEWVRKVGPSQEYPYQARAFSAYGWTIGPWAGLSLFAITIGVTLCAAALRPWPGPRALGAVCVVLVLAELFAYASQLFYEGPRGAYATRPAEWAGRSYVTRQTNKLNWIMYGARSPAAFEWARELGLSDRNIPKGEYSATGENALAPRRQRDWRWALESDNADLRANERLRRACVRRVRFAANMGAGWPPVKIEGPPRLYISELRVEDPLPRVRPLPPAAGRVELVRVDSPPERVEVACSLAHAGLVELADSYYPGWRCVVDGRRAAVHLSNELFRAVDVPRGRHRIQMAFEPQSLKWGACVSLLCAAGLVLFLCLAALMRFARWVAT